MASSSLSHAHYAVCWICPLEIEQIAATEMLDEQHPRLPQPSTDYNYYTLGSIKGHNVVIAGLPTSGNCSAASVVATMRNTFPNLKFGLLVGIGGGVPTRTEAGQIRLGHIVVGRPTDQHSGTIQYDHGKAEVDEFRRIGYLTPPPHLLLHAAQQLAVTRARTIQDPLQANLKRINLNVRGLRRFKYPGPDMDHLYEPDYVHIDKTSSCRRCGCDESKRIKRHIEYSDDEDSETQDDDPRLVVHRGTIASGELVMKDGKQRDELARENHMLCFEMEAAGVLNSLPCLVFRGISDYADSHKNDKWQGYAAAAAAAYMRELFSYMPIDEVVKCKVPDADVEQMIEHIQDLTSTNHRTKIKDWLRAPDPSTNYVQARKLCHDGTGYWLLGNEHYSRWKRKGIRAIWLYGIPGCGKTVLSSTVIQNLQASRCALLYFFFDFSDSNKRTLDSLLRSLIFQLYHQNRGSNADIDRFIASCRDGSEQPSTQALAVTLQKAIENISEAYLVIDALDECTTRSELLEWLEKFSGLSILLTSRAEQDIATSLAKWIPPENRVLLKEALLNDDIRGMIRHRTMTDTELSRWRQFSDVATTIEHKLMNKAGGMFRWVICQLDTLKKCLNRRSLMKALDALPEGLDETYARILEGLSTENRSDAVRLLQFLIFSQRPLTLEEAVDMLAVNPENEPYFDAADRMPVPAEIARYCGGLTMVTTREGEDNIEEIQLAHLSVREYLLSHRVNEKFKSSFGKARVHACIVQVSLSYMYAASQSEAKRFPFSNWAAEYWMTHAQLAESADDRISVHFMNKLFMSKEFFDYWLSIHDPDLDRPRNELPFPLYYASLVGIRVPIRSLLKASADVNAQTGRYVTPLRVAVMHGNLEIVRILIKAGTV